MSTGKYPETWRFNPSSPHILGTVEDRRTFTGRYGETEVLDIRTGEGTTYTVFMDKRALKDFLGTYNPHPGDFVSIKFTGREPIFNDDNTPAMKPDKPNEQMERMLFECEHRPAAPVSSVADEEEDDDIPW